MTEDPHIRVRRTDEPYDGGDYVRLPLTPWQRILGEAWKVAVVALIAIVATLLARGMSEPVRCVEGNACHVLVNELRP